MTTSKCEVYRIVPLVQLYINYHNLIGHTVQLFAVVFAFFGVIVVILFGFALLLLLAAWMYHRELVAQAVADDRAARDLEAGLSVPGPLKLNVRPINLERYV